MCALFIVAACGGKDSAPTAGSGTGTGTATGSGSGSGTGSGEAAPGTDCEQVIAKIAKLHPAATTMDPLSQLDDPGSDHHRQLLQRCDRWASDDDRACVIAAADAAALDACKSPLTGNHAAFDTRRGVKACDGGVVDKLACPDGAWHDKRLCIPAPAGFTADVSKWDDGGGEVVLDYPDGTRLTAQWGQLACSEVRNLIASSYTSDEIVSDCRWDGGAFAAYRRTDGVHVSRAMLCGGKVAVSCHARNAPALDVACAGLQIKR